MDFNGKQGNALKEVDRWYHEYKTSKRPLKQIYYLLGYAGTGKTTLAKYFAENINGEVLFGSFTGKAALVMAKNGCIGARTLHSLLYIAKENKKTGEVTYVLNPNSPLKGASLLIVDECSMVDDDLGKDLLSFGVPVLVLGDPGQLPPIKGEGFFITDKPDFMLTEIHRQAKDNPIIYLATEIRNGRIPEKGTYGNSSIVSSMKTSDLIEVDQVLVGRNTTRKLYNTKIRKLLGRNPVTPEVGDKIICLKNNKDLQIFNGGLFEIQEILKSSAKSQFFTFRLKSQDEDRIPFLARVHKSFFIHDVPVPHWKVLKGSCHFDYGAVITVHKAQGSQWDKCFGENKYKWLYTSVTRSIESVKLLI